MEFADMLRAIRGYRDISQEELAELTGIERPILSRIERGAVLPTILSRGEGS